MKPDKTQRAIAGSEKQFKKDFAAPCQSRKIPLWLVLLDNIPTLLLFILGFMIIKILSTIGAIIYAVYALFSIVWFWAKICPYCHHYGTQACPCGYGAISPRFFKRNDPKSFKKVFKRNILIVFPNWFVPAGIAAYLLITRFTKEELVLTILFSVIGFIIIPLISKLVGCKNCEIKEDCPWMNVNKKGDYKTT
jgi:hypothetical protein